jgi:hypothetical protein
MIVNVTDREHAIQFAENDPCALAGLHESICVHKCNAIDISGKFVPIQIGDQDNVRRVMKSLGYPLSNNEHYKIFSTI